jgi:predicted deacetylase
MTTKQDDVNIPCNWLPPGKQAAICFTIDDVHPGRSCDAYEAGGDLGRGALGHVEWLCQHHPQLQVTLFVTPAWREIGPFPTRKLLAGVPFVRNHVYLTKTLDRDAMLLTRHPEFVGYLKSLPNVDCALHGLHHINKGFRIMEEFRGRGLDECCPMLQQAIAIFSQAGLPWSPGMCPPGWGLSDDLAHAMVAAGLQFVASARDIVTPVTHDAVSQMSGRRGLALIYPQWIMARKLLHFTTNFQATSTFERAEQIVALNGLVAIKAHIVKRACGHVALDGMDTAYRDYLHQIFSRLEDRFAESLCWTSMAGISSHCRPVEQDVPALCGQMPA